MFAHTQLKTGTAAPDKTPNVLIARVMEFARWLSTPPPMPISSGEDTSDWYAGLAVDTHDFTNQLCKLQNSLRPAGQTVASKPRT
jgi:hypothetical protein